MVETGYSVICIECGVERTVLKIVAGYSENVPLWIGYSRVGRFKKILNKLLFPERYATIPSRIHYELLQKGVKFDTIAGLINAIKQYKMTNKEYNGLHLYCKLFLRDCPDVSPTPMPCIIESMCGDVNIIERRLMCVDPDARFFSYRWLLGKLLNKYKLTRYIQFVKPIVTPKTCKKYETLYNTIMNCNTQLVTEGILQKIVQ